MDPSLGQIATLRLDAQEYAFAVTDDLRAAGLPAVVVEGYRSQRRQNALFGQGRIDSTKPVVTNTLLSKHTRRTAWDTAFIVNGRLTWDVPASWWAYVGEVGEAYGLVWGGRWRWRRDRPHLELPRG